MNNDIVIPQAELRLNELGLNFDCSEVGNMERFVEQHHANLQYIPEKNLWVEWTGSQWHPCDTAQVFDRAVKTAKGIYDEARDCEKEEGKKRLTSWAFHSQKQQKINSIITMGSKHPDMVTHLTDFDTDPLKLNCLNGIVDLETGELISHTPSSLVMKQTSVAYKRHAKCPRFTKFLHDVFNEDKELIRYVQKAIGYTLTAKTSEQVFFLAYGTGANGKSTFFETILDILGDYGRSAEFETFLSNDSNTRALESVAKLKSIRFALASETDSRKRFSESLIKKITGEDTVTGSFLYHSSFEFRPGFKLWLLANHLPIVQDGTHGFWRRVVVIPFARKFSKGTMDQTLRAKLLEEAEGILAWAVRGAKDWIKRIHETGGKSGLGTCKAIDDAVAIYRSDHDIFSQFIEDRLEIKVGQERAANVLYEAYVNWCEEEVGETPCSKVIFGNRLKERNIKKRRKSSGYVYIDVCLKDDEVKLAGF